MCLLAEIILASFEVKEKFTSVCLLAGDDLNNDGSLSTPLFTHSLQSNANFNPRKAKLCTTMLHTFWKEGLAAYFQMSNKYLRPRQNPTNYAECNEHTNLGSEQGLKSRFVFIAGSTSM